MTRYSRSVIPGRSQGEDGGDRAGLDQMVFGSKKKAAYPAANDADDPDFLPPVEDDEADLLVGRSNVDRRKGEDRRKPGSERRAAPRRSSEYAPLREQGAYRGGDDSRRGPILLVGAVMIVAVFGVVVWNAYREDGAVPAEETQVLAGAGPFKRPFIDTNEPTAPTIAEQAEVLDALDGAPATSRVASSEQRPATPPPASAAPIPSNPTAAPSPAPLKTPKQGDPVRAATAVTQPGPVALTPAPQTATPKPAAAAPAPAPAPTPIVPAAVKPAFTASGAWLVQIAATGSEASAISEWTRYSKASAELFAGAERVVQQADVNGKTVYRLRVGSFASKEDAAAFCSAFKAKGGNCYPAAK